MEKFLKDHINDDKIRIYLHAGTHKTGTTAIQVFASKHRKALRKRGLLYPKSAPILYRLKGIQAHHWFAHALAGENRLSISDEQLRSYANAWINSAKRNNADLFISIEALYRHKLGNGSYGEKRKKYLERVLGLFGNNKVIVVLVFRRPDDYLCSFYKNRVMSSTTCLPDLKTFYEDKIQKGLNYYTNAVLFQEVFHNIQCLVYEDLALSNQFFTNFFTSIGKDVSDFKDVGIHKKSYRVPEILFKNFANHYISNSRENRKFIKWMSKPSIAKSISDSFDNKTYDLWPSHAARKEFLKTRGADVEKLRRAFFPDRETLFPPLNEGETLPPVPPLPKELKQMVFEYFGRKTE